MKLEKIRESKVLFSLLIITAILIALNLIGMSKLFLSYQHAEDTRRKISEMTSFIENYDKQSQTFNREKYRAVLPAQLDEVQANILFMLSANDLDLKALKNIKTREKKKTGDIYEVTFQGTWKNTLKVISNWHSKDALISILYTKLLPAKDISNGVTTTIKYKVYTK